MFDFSVHQCFFCQQTFDSAADKDDHILEHFAQVSCTECDAELIRIAEHLYVRHDDATCIKKVAISAAHVESCTLIETLLLKTGPLENDENSATSNSMTSGVFEAEILKNTSAIDAESRLDILMI